MNARQRRATIRYRHMALPIGKEVSLWCLLGVVAYHYRTATQFEIDRTFVDVVESATVFRHGRGHWVDIDVVAGEDFTTIRVPICRVCLKNPTDRAARPWWSTLRRKMKGA